THQDEDAIVQATLNPLIVSVHEFGGLRSIFREPEEHDEHRLTPQRSCPFVEPKVNRSITADSLPDSTNLARAPAAPNVSESLVLVRASQRGLDACARSRVSPRKRPGARPWLRRNA